MVCMVRNIASNAPLGFDSKPHPLEVHYVIAKKIEIVLVLVPVLVIGIGIVSRSKSRSRCRE